MPKQQTSEYKQKRLVAAIARAELDHDKGEMDYVDAQTLEIVQHVWEEVGGEEGLLGGMSPQHLAMLAILLDS